MLCAFLLSAALVFTEADAGLALSCASNLVVACTPRDAGTDGGRRAADWILGTTRRMGLDVRRDDFEAAMRQADGRVVRRRFVNLHARFGKRPQAPWIVLVSHYDTKQGTGCPGANDGASTTGLLMAMASALSSGGYAGGANILIVWLDGEECVTAYGENDGFWGSRRAVDELQRLEADVRAVICLDMLGDRDLAITIPSNGSPTLMKVAKEAASRTGVGLSLVAESVRDDHVPFLEAGYPAIDLIDFDYGSAAGRRDWWHTPQDTPDKLSRASLLQSGRLVAEIVNLLVP